VGTKDQQSKMCNRPM